MVVESKSIKVKIFINGIDVSARYSSINSLTHEFNKVSQLNLDLESPDQDFILTSEDLIKIKEARANKRSIYTFGVPGTVGSTIKTGLLNTKIYENLEYETTTSPKDQHSDPLYLPSLGESIIDFLDQVRIFVQFNGVWYWGFSGVVIGRTITIGVDDTIKLRVMCADILQLLKMATITNSLGVFEPAKLKDFFKQFLNETSGGKPTGIVPVPGTTNTNLFVMPIQQFNLFLFGQAETPSLLQALVFTIYGDVTDINNYVPGTATTEQSAALTSYEKNIIQVNGYAENINSAMSPVVAPDSVNVSELGSIPVNDGTIEMKFHGLIGNAIIEYPKNDSIKRNNKACGNFSLDKLDIRVFGNTRATSSETNPNINEFIAYLQKMPFSEETKRLDRVDWPGWELLTGNLVDWRDLIETSIVDRNDKVFLSDAIQRGTGKTISELDLEDVVNIIGTNTFRGGLWDVSAGGLKVLLPGSMTGTIYDALWTMAYTNPSVDYFALTTRLEILGQYLGYRSDLIFYASPKGHIVVEMPLYDYNYFGEEDPVTGLASRSLLKGDLIGALSDSVSMDNLYSMCEATPQFGLNGTILSPGQGGGQEYVRNQFDVQVAISPRLFFKLGPKTLKLPSVFSGNIKTSDGAAYLAAIELSKANRMAHGLSLEIKYNPAFVLNRQLEVMDRPNATIFRRAGLVKSQSTTIVKDQRVSMTINLGFVRGWDGTEYKSVLGEPLDSLAIDYGTLLNQTENTETPEAPTIGMGKEQVIINPSQGGAGRQ